VICLDDKDYYVQATRRRFTARAANEYMKTVNPVRKPLKVAIESAELDVKGYPLDDERSEAFIAGMCNRVGAEA